MGVRARVHHGAPPVAPCRGHAEPPADYEGFERLPSWEPGKASQGDGTYQGSNVDLGTPDDVVEQLRAKLQEMDELLAFGAKINARLRSTKVQKIMMRAELLRKCPAEHEVLGKIKSASVREQWLELHMAEILAEEAEAKIAWELVQRAGRTHEAQLDGIRSLGARIGGQYHNDGRQGFDDYRDGDRQRRRGLARGAGKRMAGH